MRILVIDDTPLICDLLSMYLKSAGFETTIATNASEAFSALAGQPAFDLLVLDLLMPKLDGLQFLEQLRLQERFRSLPVLMLTSSHNPSDILRARRLGVRDYVLKDNLGSTLLGRIQSCVAVAV